MRDLNAQRDETERQIQLEQQREGEMLQSTYHASFRFLFADGIFFIAIEIERHTVADLSTSLARLQASFNKIRETGANLDGEMGSIRKDIRADRATKERQGRVLAENREMDMAQLQVLEDALGLSIQGVGGELTSAC